MEEYIIDNLSSVNEVLKRLESLRPKIVFVCHERKLLGSVTDGDIRRFLLNGGKTDANICNVMNPNPIFAQSVQEANKKYNRRDYIAIPILDSNNNVCDIYTGNSGVFFEKNALDVPIVINAGGRGTRLEPFTKVLPKPLIPVGELPIIEHIINQFSEYQCEDFHIIVNYKKELIKAYFSDVEGSSKYRITWYDEKTPLGTGGGLSLIKGRMKETFIFSNCDTLLLMDYSNALKFHRENKNIITMICAYKKVNIPYGVIEMGENGRILNIKEKPEFTFLTNTGVYIVEPEVLDDMEDNISVGFPDVIERQRKLGRTVAVYPIRESEWLDMGQMSELEKMRVRLYGE